MLEIVGFGLIFPALTSFAILLLAHWLGEEQLTSRLSALAVGSGFILAYHLFPWIEWLPEPRRSWHWLAPLALIAILLAFTDSPTSEDSPPKPPWRLVVTATLSWFLVPSYPEFSKEIHRHCAVLAAGVIVSGIGISRIGQRVSGPAWPIALTLTAVTVSFVCFANGFAMLAQLTGAIAGSLAGAMVLACIYRRERIFAGLSGLMSVLLVGSLYVSWAEAISHDIPLYCYFLVAFAPLSFLLVIPESPAKPVSVARRWIGAGLVMAPLIIAIVVILNKVAVELPG